MDQILDIPTENPRRMEYAGFWIRVVAYIIDGILLSGVNYALTLFMISGFADGPNYGLTAISVAIGVLYFALMESSDKQATLGKMALSIKVGDMNGNKISFGNAVGRYFAKIVSALILGIGFMMAGWDDRKQALHDKMADTTVFYSR